MQELRSIPVSPNNNKATHVRFWQCWGNVFCASSGKSGDFFLVLVEVVTAVRGFSTLFPTLTVRKEEVDLGGLFSLL